MKRIVRLFSLCFAALIPFLPLKARADAGADALRFHEDGSFTVMLLADAQDTQYPSAYLISSMQAVLNNYQVDLVVLLGDQLEGSSPVLRIGDDRKNVEKALGYLLAPLENEGVPFAFVLGNHDYDAPLSPAEQIAIYRSYSGCLAPDIEPGEAYCLPVYPNVGDAAALQLYFFDSGPDTAEGYGAVSAAQVDWYRGNGDSLYTKNTNQTTPAVAFQHVPVAEVYELFTEVPAGTAGALARGGRYYVLNEALVLTGEALEAPCPSLDNHGLFDAFKAQGDVFLAMSGHDHVNSFIGSADGVDLGEAPGSSYTSYGDARARGVRLLRFYEDDVKSYNTIHVRYADFIKTDGLSSVRYYLSTTTRIPNAVKTFVLFLLFIALIGWIIWEILRARKHPRPAPAPGEDTGYDDAPSEEEHA